MNKTQKQILSVFPNLWKQTITEYNKIISKKGYGPTESYEKALNTERPFWYTAGDIFCGEHEQYNSKPVFSVKKQSVANNLKKLADMGILRKRWRYVVYYHDGHWEYLYDPVGE